MEPPHTELEAVMVASGAGFTMTVVVEGAELPQALVRVTV